MKKLLFIDVDGTLVDYDGTIPQSAVEAIRKARANGHKVYICTGRSEAEVYPEIWAIGLDGMIGANGAYIKDGDQVILHRRLTADQCRRVVDWCHQRHLEFYLESNAGLFSSENFELAGTEAMREYNGRKGRSRNITVREAFPYMIFGADLYRDDVNKISFILSSYQDHLDSIRDFPDLEANTWGGVGEKALFGDLAVRGITKKNAVETLVSHLNRDIRDTIAFGDAKIDIPMFEACGYGVAMGSGGEECKKAADYITASVSDDGLKKAFEHLHLI
ncbi:MAG: HAD family hydrolase [Erysipelotrichaceae bacterium]|nr:HAD family hydrolase [Erysipelotrichaceae bacterium]